MAVKIGNLNRWRKLPMDACLDFPVESGFQRIRIEFNTEHDTRIAAVDAKEQETFVATIKGNDTVEFTVDGPVTIVALSEGEVWYHTPDGQADAFDLSHLRSFRGIMQRQPRNPELERIMHIMTQNQRRVEMALQETKAMYEAAQEAKNGRNGTVDTSGDASQTTEPAKPATAPTEGEGA